MRKEYDLSRLKGRKNPYARRLKKQVTMRLDLLGGNTDQRIVILTVPVAVTDLEWWVDTRSVGKGNENGKGNEAAVSQYGGL